MTHELGNGTDGCDEMGSAMRISLLVALSNNAFLTLLGFLLLACCTTFDLSSLSLYRFYTLSSLSLLLYNLISSHLHFEAYS